MIFLHQHHRIHHQILQSIPTITLIITQINQVNNCFFVKNVSKIVTISLLFAVDFFGGPAVNTTSNNVAPVNNNAGLDFFGGPSLVIDCFLFLIRMCV